MSNICVYLSHFYLNVYLLILTLDYKLTMISNSIVCVTASRHIIGAIIYKRNMTFQLVSMKLNSRFEITQFSI